MVHKPGDVVAGQAAGDARHGPTDEPDDCKFCDYKSVCRVQVDDWWGVESPFADWSKEHSEGIDGYRHFRLLRSLDA